MRAILLMRGDESVSTLTQSGDPLAGAHRIRVYRDTV
jgi:hypothetical protein